MNQSLSRGIVSPQVLTASLILGLMAVTGMYLLPKQTDQTVMALNHETHISKPGDIFTVKIETTSDTPVNAFMGLVRFNEEVLSVENINYNTSFADLWAVTPWYKNGAGTVEFAGGTTRPGGFVGTDTILTISFKALAPGNANLVLEDTQILMHDGLGTEALLTDYIDTLFITEAEKAAEDSTNERIAHEAKSATEVIVLNALPTPDINNDGVVDLTDISLFLLFMPNNNSEGDLNRDGKVNTADLSILLQARSH